MSIENILSGVEDSYFQKSFLFEINILKRIWHVMKDFEWAL